MLLFKGYYLLLVFMSLFCTDCCNKENQCPTQHALLLTEGKFRRVVWKTKSHFFQSVAISDPPCLDKNDNLMGRVCSDGSWKVSRELCSRLEKNALCPAGFIEEEKTCIFLTKPRNSERRCPFPGASAKLQYNTKGVWLPVQRNDRYGSFEYLLPGKRYGTDFFEDYPSHASKTWNPFKSCLTAGYNSIELAACGEQHIHVCSYRYNQFMYKCPRGCVPGGLGSDYCFCKVVSGDRKNKQEWCDKLAKPTYGYERRIVQKLVGNNVCWVGDIQQNAKVRPDIFPQLFSIAINKYEWSFHKNGELNCAICQVDALPYEKIDLILSFNLNWHKLYLNVYSPESLFGEDEEDSVYCFTDATDDLKRRVDVESSWDSQYEPFSGRRVRAFKVEIIEDEPGYYWCEVFQKPSVNLVKSNVVIAYKELKGHEYALRIVVYNLCQYSNTECKNPSVQFLTRVCKNLFSGGFFSRFIKKVRLFHIYNIDVRLSRADVLLHFTTKKNQLPLLAEYYTINRNLQWLKARGVRIAFFRSSEVCIPDTTEMDSSVLHWQMTSIGLITTPVEVCIQEDSIPVRRKCMGDFKYGSRWGQVEGRCSRDVQLSSKTQLLHSIIVSGVSANVTKNISTVTKNATDLSVVDLHYLAEALKKVLSDNDTSQEELVEDISDIVDDLLEVNSTIMKLSQVFLNATDEILDAFENALFSFTATNSVFIIKKHNLVIQITEPLYNNITGLALYDDDDSLLDCDVVPLYANTSYESLLDDDNLVVAVYIPEKLLNVISQNSSNTTQGNLSVVITVYCTDKFFNNLDSYNNSVASKVVSVSIPNYGDLLQTAIPIIFNTRKEHNNQTCAFWNYGLSSENRSGYWSSIGGNYLGQKENSSLEICSYTHLTNFALLIMNSGLSASGDDSVSFNLTANTHDAVLTALSNVGCVLSLIGLFGIFLTSLLFQSWREKVGTQILIQMCITIFLQIVFINIADVGSSSMGIPRAFCMTVGIILHYVIISEFCWMLVAAILQFFRFVKVIGPLPDRLILKSTIIGWGLPVIPVLIVCIADPRSYASGLQGLCYPKGASLYYGVLVPVALIVCANLAIFIAVIRNVFVLRVEAHSGSQTIVKQQICLAVLLFFLLGLPWAFGILAEVMSDVPVMSYIFVYVFCITATLQGFVLFVFYVVLDRGTRTLWIALFKKCIHKKA